MTGFRMFWYMSAAVLAALGLATFLEVHHGHRLAAFLVILSTGCFAIAYVMSRAPDR
jgi:hypothetical protein